MAYRPPLTSCNILFVVFAVAIYTICYLWNTSEWEHSMTLFDVKEIVQRNRSFEKNMISFSVFSNNSKHFPWRKRRRNSKRFERAEYSVSKKITRWFGKNFTVASTLDTGFLINPTDLCPKDMWLDYLLVVKTAPENFNRRQIVRDTVGNKELFKHVHHRLVFMIGTTGNVEVLIELSKEVIIYNDLVQGPFVDNYRNLTLKGVMSLHWISLYCSRTHFVINIDDDTFFNVFKVVDTLLPMMSGVSHQMACPLYPYNRKLIERTKTRWAVDRREFRGLLKYPFSHCNGYFVIMTGDMIEPMLHAAQVTPAFWIDDVFLYGLLPHRIGDVKFTSLESNKTFFSRDERECLESKGLDCELLIFCEFRKGDSFDNLKRELWTLLKSNFTSRKSEFHHLS